MAVEKTYLGCIPLEYGEVKLLHRRLIRAGFPSSSSRSKNSRGVVADSDRRDDLCAPAV